MKDTIKLLEKNNKEGKKLVKKLVAMTFQAAMEDDVDLEFFTEFQAVEQDLELNIIERKKLLEYLKEQANG